MLKQTIRRYRTGTAVTVLFLVLGAGVAYAASAMYESQANARARAAAAQRREDARSLLMWLETDPTRESQETETARFNAILDAISSRILSGHATELERRAFVRTFFACSFVGRRLVNLIDVSQISLKRDFRSRLTLSHPLGLLTKGAPLMDRAPIPGFSSTGHGDLVWLQSATRVSCSLGQRAVETTAIGYHILSGTVRIQIVEALDFDAEKDGLSCPERYAQPEVDYRVIPGAVVEQPIERLEFTVVDKYPANYPPRVIDENIVRKIDGAFKVKLQRGEAPAFLQFTMTIPVPKITIACEVRFSADVLPPDHSMWLIASPERWEVRSGRRGVSSSSSKWVTRNEQTYSIVWKGSLHERESAVSVGDTVDIELIASEAVARGDPSVSEYLDLRIMRSVEVTQCVSDE